MFKFKTKKILSSALITSMVFAMGTTSFAKTNDSGMEYIFSEDELYGISATTKMILIENDKLSSFSQSILEDTLNNGVSIMFYGNSISFDSVKESVGDESSFRLELSPNIENELTGLAVTVDDGKYQYSGVVDATNILVENVETGEQINIGDIQSHSTGMNFDEHSPLDFVEEIYSEIVSEPKTRMPASGADEIKGNWFYDFGKYGEMKAPVYCYYGGYTSGEHYWDLLTSMTANPTAKHCVVDFSTEIDVGYYNQALVDWTNLPSKTDSLTVSLGGNSSSITGGISYSTSTTGLKITPYINYANATAKWYVNSRPLFLFQGDGVPVKIEPAVRVSNTSSTIKFTRYYYMDIENVISGTAYRTNNMYSTFTVSP